MDTVQMTIVAIGQEQAYGLQTVHKEQPALSHPRRQNWRMGGKCYTQTSPRMQDGSITRCISVSSSSKAPASMLMGHPKQCEIMCTLMTSERTLFAQKKDYDQILREADQDPNRTETSTRASRGWHTDSQLPQRQAFQGSNTVTCGYGMTHTFQT